MRNFLSILFSVFMSTSVAAICGLAVVVLYTNAQLPEVHDLEDIQLQVPLKIYTADGKLIGEYGEKRRTPITISEVPETLKQAILATEDRRFYDHNGIDIRGIARAIVKVVGSGTKAQGASTITMQVARNFYLTRQKTFGRKLNEALLALKIEQELSKDKILELYLNKIYFGKRAYGVQAAAQVYYGTTVDKLDLAQMAMIAGLPQAPSAINPINNPEAALKRRTHVLKRMLHYGFIDQAAYDAAVDTPITANYHGRFIDFEAPYVSEIARKELVEKFGPDVYTSGYVVYTTVDSRLQTLANEAMQTGLLAYDKRHGYRGPVAQLAHSPNTKINVEIWAKELRTYPKTALTLPAAIIKVNKENAEALLPNGQTTLLSFESMRWANRQISRLRVGRAPESCPDVVAIGDIIYVEPSPGGWRFSQRPEIEGALVSLHPKNGAVLAMVGGFDYNVSYFNRATQSIRQPGSNFKPFIYAAALERGFTAASIINDAPVVFRTENVDDVWRPQNDTRKFYGPTRLRIGLTKSRNLVSIRLLQAVGMGNALKIIQRFGFDRKRLPRSLSLALGTASVSPLEVATGYAAFANGGYKVTPHVVQRVQNIQNKIIYEATSPTVCPECVDLAKEEIDPLIVAEQKNPLDELAENSEDDQNTENTENTENAESEKSPAKAVESADRIISPQTAYIMTSILQDAIQTGTGKAARVLNRSDLAGKTGTTNNKVDAWYTGYNQSLVTSVWVGYDDPRTIQEYGSQAALPIWMKFMGEALKDVPQTAQKQPRGLITVKIDPATGLLAHPGQSNAIFEVFKAENAPKRTAHTFSPTRNAITPRDDSGGSLF